MDCIDIVDPRFGNANAEGDIEDDPPDLFFQITSIDRDDRPMKGDGRHLCIVAPQDGTAAGHTFIGKDPMTAAGQLVNNDIGLSQDLLELSAGYFWGADELELQALVL